MVEKHQESNTSLDENGQRWHRQLPGRLLWLDRPDIKNAVCQPFDRVGTATIRDEGNVMRLLRYLVGNPSCNKLEVCTLDVPAAAGTPLGSVFW